MLRLFVIGVMFVFAADVGFAAPGPAAPSTPRTGGNEAAEKNYKAGLRHKDAAWVYEEKIAGTKKEEDRMPYVQFVQRTYKRAVEAFQKAVAHDPNFHEAYSSLGYVLRKTGDLDGALKAYDRALELNPTYSEAIEYRAEAYFELGRIEDAKKAYAILAGLHKPYAVRLLDFAEKWVAEQDNMALQKKVGTWAKEQRAALGKVDGWVEKW